MSGPDPTNCPDIAASAPPKPVSTDPDRRTFDRAGGAGWLVSPGVPNTARQQACVEILGPSSISHPR
jgi:hypothetical protein